MKITLSFTDLDPAEAAHLLAQAGGRAPAASAPAGNAPQTPAAPPPTAAPAGAPPPPPSAPAGAPQTAPAAPPPPVTTGATNTTVLAAMQKYSQTHKAAGVKAVLAKCGLTGIGTANQEQLTWLQQVFDSNVAPEALG